MLPDIETASALPPLTASCVMRVGDTALLADHRPVMAADTLAAAVNAIEELDETAKPYRLRRGLIPRLLFPAQVAELGLAFGGLPEPHAHGS